MIEPIYRPDAPATAPHTLMLVSARADGRLRDEVQGQARPRPEFLHLAQTYGVELLDWSQLPAGPNGRSHRQSVRHVIAALRRLKDYEVVFSDGEHLGIPLSLAMRRLGITTPHLTIGHHLTTATKKPFFRWLGADQRISRILVHSRNQLELAQRRLGISGARLAYIPYFVDSAFWRPRPDPEDSLIVSAGLEHRDYLTLARACSGLPERVLIASGSLHSPRARCRMPEVLPPGFEIGFATYGTLRGWYARASLVVIPLMQNDFQAGVTSLLEAMAMGKAVIVTATDGQGDVVEHGVTGLLVPPSDAGELRRVIRWLLAHPAERARLGANARRAVENEFSLEKYTSRLAAHLREVATVAPAAA